MHYSVEKIIKNSPHLSWMKDNTILVSLHGSRAYGTNIEGSDEDFKGICIADNKHYHGFLTNFEQAIINEPDTVIYEIKKFFKLASDCNPNIMEVLFCDESDILYINNIGKKIIENRELFLSKKARFTFSGYAVSQLKRIKLHRNYLLNPPNKIPLRSDFGLPDRNPIPANQLTAAKAAINKEIDKLNFKFLDQLDVSERIEVRNKVTDLLDEYKIYNDERHDAMARKVGFDENLIEILKLERSYDNSKKEWDNYQNWKKNRNPKRAADEAKFGLDLKHAYHLVRLMRMCKEILSTGEVLVKRPDREELLEIRCGKWSYEKIIEHAESIEQDIDSLYDKSKLPHKPNLNKLNDLCIELIESGLNQ